jgi:hypothetical protein
MSATRRAGGESATGRPGSDAAVRGALLIGVAVVIGLLLLWRGHDDDGGGTISAEGTPVATSAAPGDTTPEGTPATNPGDTTVPPATTHAPAEVKVLVANGTGTQGGAAFVTNKLVPKAYATMPAANAGTDDVAKSLVFYREGFGEDAKQVARDVGVPEDAIAGLLEPMPETPPVNEQAMQNAQGAHVLVLLGSDGVIPQA